MLSKKNKSGQIGDTLTWVVATIAIITILGIFIYISSVLITGENFSGIIKSLFSDNANEASANRVGLKTSLAFEITDKNKSKIRGWIENAKES